MTTYPGKGRPWADFLHHRMRLLASWRAEGKTAEECVRDLATDPVQIQLLWMTYDRDPSAYPAKEVP